jgi:hypothetical protein
MWVTNSITGEAIAEVPCYTMDEVNWVVEAAALAFLGWADTPVIQRTQLVFKFQDKVVRMVNTILQAIINGLMIGGFYALIGMGLNCIFGVMKIINFCQGELMISYLRCSPFFRHGSP